MPAPAPVSSPARSRERLVPADLARLAALAAADREDLFSRKPELGARYRNRVLCVALCQGAAQHHLDGRTGIKDFDVWTFFAAHADGPFPHRRRRAADFGPSRFGRTPSQPEFAGRRVDMLARSLSEPPGADPVAALRRYLESGATETARRLAAQAAVILWPQHLRGTVAWPLRPPSRRPGLG